MSRIMRSSTSSGIYARFDALESDTVRSVSFTPGFPLADIAECGPAVFAYGDDQASADHAAAEVLAQVVGARSSWNGELLAPDDAVNRAVNDFKGRPFVLADTQDNPGAGGASDTVGLLESLARLGAEDAVFGLLYDPPAADAAHAAGIEASLSLALGASSNQPGHQPFRGDFVVEALSDGEFAGAGPMSRGRIFRLGPTALLRTGGVRVVVVSGRAQVLDQEMFRHLGLDPARQRILAIKSSVHFRAVFQDMAEQVLVVVAPGPNVADHRALRYKNLRPGLALMP
jgi:microcystin degradation protein MlrC